jgi:hypothetical protein
MLHFIEARSLLREETMVPRYFFHVYDGDTLMVCDSQGFDLHTKSAAIEKWASIIRAVIDEEAFAEIMGDDRVIRVVDEKVGCCFPCLSSDVHKASLNF